MVQYIIDGKVADITLAGLQHALPRISPYISSMYLLFSRLY